MHSCYWALCERQMRKHIKFGLVLQPNTEKSTAPNDLPGVPHVMWAQAPVSAKGTDTLLKLATHHCA